LEIELKNKDLGWKPIKRKRTHRKQTVKSRQNTERSINSLVGKQISMKMSINENRKGWKTARESKAW